MSQAVLPFAFVSITVGPLVLPVPVCLILDPLADIAISTDTFPNAVAVLDSIRPFAIVSVTRDPRVQTFTADCSSIVFTEVLVPVTKSLVAFPVAFVIGPLTFVDPPNFVDADAKALTVAFD